MPATSVFPAAGTFAVVLVPTRELALQTHEVVEKLCQPLREAKLLKIFRLICGLDLVPAVPMYALGYRHFGKPALLFERDREDLLLLFGINKEHKDGDRDDPNACNLCCAALTSCCVERKPWEGTRFSSWLDHPKCLLENHKTHAYYERCMTMDREMTTASPSSK